MAHDIFGTRFLSRQKPAWHNIGQTFDLDADLTMEEAVRRAGLDYTITVGSMKVVLPDGTQIDHGDTSVIVREPTKDDNVHRVFGTAGPDFKVLQNLEAARVIDRAFDTKYPVETAGALGHGEKIFLSLRGGDYRVANVDDIVSYYVLEINHVPGRANRILYTPVRVVCANTLSMGTRQATLNLTIPHTGNPAALLEFGARVSRQLVQAEEFAKAVFNAMAAVKITDRQLTAMLDAVWPDQDVPKKAKLIQGLSEDQMAELLHGPSSKTAIAAVDALSKHEYWLGRLREYRAAAAWLYRKFNDEHPKLAGTVWAAYNACTECSDWRNGGRTVDESVLFGARADEKKRAFAYAQSLVTVGSN